MRTGVVTLLLAASLGAACQSPPPEEASRHFEVRAELGVMITMRDGVRLSTDLYFPDGAEGKLPIVLWRSIYDKTGAIDREPGMRELVSRGYVAVIQDTRGRGASEGEFLPSVGDRNDGYDTVQWLTSQPWSNGKLGSAGCSSLGESQVLMAAARHPNHIAMVPMSASSALNMRGRPWESFDGGAFALAQTAGWFSVNGRGVDYGVLPIVDVLKQAGRPASAYEQFASSAPEAGYFLQMDWLRPGETLDVPALFFDSWYDYGPRETLDMFNMVQDERFVLIAPGTHCSYLQQVNPTIVGERDLGDARVDALDLEYRWFDYWLKGIDNGVTNRAPITYYVMGANQWREADAWPVPGTRYENWYLSSGGNANSLDGDGLLSQRPPEMSGADTFRYDPGNPAPSIGGHSCCTGTEKESGGYDQREVERRDDVLVYTSEPLQQGIEVTGPLTLVLQVSSSAPDTDFVAKLIDVYPDGRAFNIQEGALRMRWREGYAQELRMHAGEVYEANIDLYATSNWFGPGHRIRVDVSSSDFPRWDRNLNTGGNNYDEVAYNIADNTVHYSAERPSVLILPVVESMQPQ